MPYQFTPITIEAERGKPLDPFLKRPLYIPELSLLFVTDIPATDRIFPSTGKPTGCPCWPGTPVTRRILNADLKKGILALDQTTRALTTLAARY
ncbi:uncharacterized protein BO97DRAFT_428287 [Aspergillus homomorphus CBS 101889]|uniref:Uncharacterized protein n=1 Tax=Aspergillus homomorphus (strain CBS 101889) TaxID=1450537 RepID=A0A395HKJ7_ASPHC|nr:hypothetical protein BO97DRAFT_428287 [Aspergillus homomorphus CBS 101889]RAL08461.1 hypothetical protein BO97DRAFT_428287 [Aspergillus homomorphus CBS 101889]